MNRTLRTVVAVLSAVSISLIATQFVIPPSLTIVNLTPTFGGVKSRASNALYWIPDTAAILDIPLGSSTEDSCSPSLTAWLNQHATRVISPQELLLTNDSTHSERVYLRFTASTLPESDKLGFELQCGDITLDDSAISPSGSRPWKTVAFHLDTQKANELLVSTGGERPYTQIIQAGQQVGLTLFLTSDQRIAGELQLSTSKAGLSTLAVPILSHGPSSGTIAWPGATPATEVFVHIEKYPGEHSQLYCVNPPETGAVLGFPCTTTEVRDLIHAYEAPTPTGILPLQ